MLFIAINSGTTYHPTNVKMSIWLYWAAWYRKKATSLLITSASAVINSPTLNAAVVWGLLPAPCVCGCCPAPSESAPPSPASCPADAAGSSGRSLSPELQPGRSAPAPLPDEPHCPVNATPAPARHKSGTNGLKPMQDIKYYPQLCAECGSASCALTSNLLTCPLWNSSLFSRSHTRASCLLTMLRPTVDDSKNCTLDAHCWSCTMSRWRKKRATWMHQYTSASPDACTYTEICDKEVKSCRISPAHLIHKPLSAVFMFWLCNTSYLFLQRVSLFLHLLQFSLKLSDLRNVTGGLKPETEIWFQEE